VIPLTLAAIAEITGASLGPFTGPAALVRSVVIDSRQAGVAGLIVVGEEAAPMLTGAKAERSWHGELIGVPDAGSAVAVLGNLLAPGDVVLVKASRAAGLEHVALALTGEAAQ
jgi:UDP-N-acetylmuramoyl-tripeptide--D-alanyl-D-alanine ligase